ncbi:hypothetical protein BGW37DRAFT_546403 [Umbelopsis sp. PMI_123]|nr:hypothetical protein BGW37DRAFT_546403 [Umbelopsis sp. PMI_123]
MKGSIFRSHAAIACTSVHPSLQHARITPVKKVVSYISNGIVLRSIKKKLAGRASPIKGTFGGRPHSPTNESDLFEPITSCIAPPRPHTPPLDYSSSTSDESSACSIVERWVSDTSSIYTEDDEKSSAQLSLPYYERLLPQHRVQQLAWNDTATIIIPTWSKSKYDRSPHPHTTYLHLTPLHTEQIRKELNEYKKNEMSVHSDSRIHTAWH